MKYNDLEIHKSEFINLNEILEKMEYNKRDSFIYHLNPHYFSSLYDKVEESDRLMTVARANYSASFCEQLKEYIKKDLHAVLWNEYIREEYTALGSTFKTYANDPNGQEWTHDNIDTYLWQYYNRVDINPWNDKPREYTKDWFDRFTLHYQAFMKVWGQYVKAGESDRIKTAVKMCIIRACIPDYWN